MALLEGRSQREIVEDALRDYVGKLSAEDRRMVDALSRRATPPKR
jgi:Arc/MetJ family transcription regulator